MPVLPAVASTISPPGLIWPRFSASRIICRAGRSFTDWSGFMNSALPRIAQPVAADARLSAISGVFPIAATTSSRICIARRSMRERLVHRFDVGERAGSVADDEHPGLLVLGAVPMHLLGEVGDEAAGRHRHHFVLVEFVSGRDPPRSFDHGDEAIVGMEVRLAEVARLETVENDVGAGLGRIAM